MGGGSGSTTTTVDPVYNAGILKISQEQQDWARTMENMFQYGVPYNPSDTAFTDSSGNVYTADQAQSMQQQINPAWTEYQNKMKGINTPTQLSGYDSSGVPIFTGGNNPAAVANLGPEPSKYLPSGLTQTTMGEANNYNAGDNTSEMQYLQNLVNANQSLLGLQTDVSKEQLNTQMAQQKAAQQLLPQQTEAASKRLGLANNYFQNVDEGINIPERMNQAGAEVQQSFKNANKTNALNVSSFGLDPNSGKFMSQARENANAEATGVAAARTAAKNQAQQEDFARKTTALGLSF